MDNQALRGNCSSTCPAGAVAPLLAGVTGASSELRDALVFMSFALEPYRDPGSNRQEVKPVELGRFLADEAYLQKRRNSSYSYQGTYAVATQFLDSSSRTLLCPKISNSAPASEMPTVTGPGCPCNFTSGAQYNRCPAGYRCNRVSYLGLSTDVLHDSTWAQLPGICVGCDAGQYCAEGECSEIPRNLDCPAGFYCPSPGEIITCPAGFFCAGRAQSTTTCNYKE
ncbi:hypothetical protein TSOC_000201 [Tetrabaena socialis]|uniref:Uncharacterized protein n=1 Tax=Tetrabaena socialis TaxID=47790 RepID=A0A2J8AJY9_9CHLO|nr:hypothetical protein TSOC_000201 [Tetrabaena socialis]|eukprot:PNH12831.1 hypothetical protein TSOC_000201 [Tetrabaena socialis]